MKPLTPIGSPSPLRLLNKGPEYLRRQMDSGGRGRSVSAVERLEADKAKYVKSQQVMNTKQEPVLVPCTTPPPQPRRPLTVPCASVPLPPRRPLTVPYSAPPALMTRPFNLRHEKEDASQDPEGKKENQNVEEEESNRNNAKNTPTTPPTPPNNPVLRRSGGSGKRMLRPDSLVIYRQKRECKTSGGSETKGYSFVRRLFQGSMREKTGGMEIPPKMIINEEKTPPKEEESRMSWANEREIPNAEREERVPKGLPETEGEAFVVPKSPQTLERTRRNGTVLVETGQPAILRHKGLQRSKSDLWLRYSLALSEKERFFNYCGLDLEMVDRLGLENFFTTSSDTVSVILRSVSAGGSEASEFSRHSGEGLFEEELTEQVPSVVSVIERNARVIKWLYGCKNAKDTPKESTV
ncbi:protein FAM110C [Amia ocellicauda]|uniref:protein FAM110C n=1 Tax=Amia ocellicauda TaxID=2972642 RepID=UPI003464C95E